MSWPLHAPGDFSSSPPAPGCLFSAQSSQSVRNSVLHLENLCRCQESRQLLGCRKLIVIQPVHSRGHVLCLVLSSMAYSCPQIAHLVTKMLSPRPLRDCTWDGLLAAWGAKEVPSGKSELRSGTRGVRGKEGQGEDKGYLGRGVCRGQSVPLVVGHKARVAALGETQGPVRCGNYRFSPRLKPHSQHEIWIFPKAHLPPRL